MLEKEISDLIEKYYDIGPLSHVHEIFGGYNSRAFGIRTTEGHGARAFFVRLYRDGVEIKEILFEHSLISHAIENGITICAGVIPTRKGQTLVQLPGSGKLYAVFDYLSGEDKYSWYSTGLTHNEFRSAGAALADFHNAVHDFDPAGLEREEPPIASFLPVMARNFTEFGQQMRPGRLQSYYTENLNAILSSLDRNRISQTEIEGLPVIPAHYDFHPGNLKWDREEVIGLFDFDWSKMDLRLFDVCMAIVYFCTQWDGSRDGELLLDKFSLFLDAYQRRLRSRGGPGPLSSEEKRLMPKILAVANLYLVHWEVSNLNQNKDMDENEYLWYLQHNIRLGSWIEANGTAITDTIHQTG